jgi:PAS domain S-box-containing protein
MSTYHNLADIQSKILIVDDSPEARLLMETLLRKDCYNLSFASNGEEAIEKAKEIVPDLILLDVNMPGMNGIEVCKILRSDPKLFEVPIIQLTALNDRESKLESIKAGADDFISKPFDNTELQLRVRTITRLDRFRRLMTERNLLQKSDQEKEEIRISSEQAISEREKRYQNVGQLSPVGIFSTNEKGEIIYVNERWTKITGIQAEEAKGTTWLEQVHIFDRKRVEAEWICAVKESSSFISEYRIVNRNNETIWIFAQAIAVVDTNRNFHGFDGTITNISERKKQEKELLNAISATQEAERKRFAEELHDGVGQLLSATKMYLLAMSETDSDDANPKLLQNSVELLTRAIQETRMISRGLSPLSIKEEGLTTAISSLVELYSKASQFDIQFTHNYELQLNEEFETGIYRIIQEALNNSCKHSKAEHIKISLQSEANKYILLEIEDDGIGFDPSKVKQNGLGLSNLRSRTNFLGGKIKIETKPNAGTYINVEIPLE